MPYLVCWFSSVGWSSSKVAEMSLTFLFLFFSAQMQNVQHKNNQEVEFLRLMIISHTYIMFLVFFRNWIKTGKQTTSLVISICGQIFLQPLYSATFAPKLMDRSTFAPLLSNEEPDYLLTLLVWRLRWMWHNKRGSQCQACGCSAVPIENTKLCICTLLAEANSLFSPG